MWPHAQLILPSVGHPTKLQLAPAAPDHNPTRHLTINTLLLHHPYSPNPKNRKSPKFPNPFLPPLSFSFDRILQSSLSHELANSQVPLVDADSSNQRLVRAFYDALIARDSHAVLKLVASDLEWWFHGPPSHQFLMRLLTGDSSAEHDPFQFVPQSIVSFGNTVIAEGCDTTRDIAWVHAWTVTDGIITQVREYFNTSLTVTRIGDSDSDSDSESPEIVPATNSDSGRFPCVWESRLSGLAGKSVPGLVLAI